MDLAPAVRPEARPAWPSARTGFYAVLSSLKICKFHDSIINFILFLDFHMSPIHWGIMHAWRLWLILVLHSTPECVMGEPCKAPKMFKRQRAGCGPGRNDGDQKVAH